MSKVGVLNFFRLTNISRFEFDAAALTPGSNDPIGMSGGVSKLLRSVGTYPVSVFVFLCWIDLYRFDLQFSTSTDWSVDVPVTSGVVLWWLCYAGAFQVSRFDFLHYFVIDTLDLDLYRLDLDGNTSTPGSNDPMQTFRVVSVWLVSSGPFWVSLFNLLCLADICRHEFDSSTSPSTSDKSVRMICRMDGWPRQPR